MNINIQKKKHSYKEDIIDKMHIFDNFLSKKDFNIMNKIALKYIYPYDNNDNDNDNNRLNEFIKYGHTSVGKHPYYIPHWSITLTNEDFFNTYLLSILENSLNKKFYIKRIYCSLQDYGHIGNWHIDDCGNNTYTFTIYSNIENNDFQYYQNKKLYTDFFNDKTRKYTNNYNLDSSNTFEYNINDLKKNKSQIIDMIDNNDNNGYFHIKLHNTNNLSLKIVSQMIQKPLYH